MCSHQSTFNSILHLQLFKSKFCSILTALMRMCSHRSTFNSILYLQEFRSKPRSILERYCACAHTRSTQILVQTATNSDLNNPGSMSATNLSRDTPPIVSPQSARPSMHNVKPTLRPTSAMRWRRTRCPRGQSPPCLRCPTVEHAIDGTNWSRSREPPPSFLTHVCTALQPLP